VSEDPKAPAANRYPALDIARGIAIAMMALYHAAWDADFLGLAPPQFFAGWGWEWFRYAILGAFLLLVGISLVLGHGDGFRARRFWRRLALIAVCAGLITLVSALAFAQHMIVFGVLHAIAVSSLLALPFVRLHWLVPALAGATIIAAGALSSAAFDTLALGWIGFMARPPASRDFVPLVPWFGVVLLGVALARLRLARAAPASGRKLRGAAARLFALGGRHSLVVYMAHQPLIFLTLAGIAALVLPQGAVNWTGGGGAVHSAAYGRSFSAACKRSCVRGGLSAGACADYCQCMLNRVRRELATADLDPRTISPQNRARLRALGRQCLARGGNGKSR
jgi:uncharacterized membrane protein